MGVGAASVSPERFEFSYVEPGEEQQQTVTLTNSGEGPLRLHDFGGGFSTEYRLYWQRGRTSSPLDEQEAGVEDGENTFPEEIEVMAGEAVLDALPARRDFAEHFFQIERAALAQLRPWILIPALLSALRFPDRSRASCSCATRAAAAS